VISSSSELSRSSDALYVGIDIGGSSIKVGVVTNSGRVLSRYGAPSALEAGLEAGLSTLERLVHAAVAEAGCTLDEVHGIGVAAPGTMDIPAGIVFHPFNLPGWENLPLRNLIAERFGRPAVLQNDANAAALGESWLGAARGARSVMFWTLGTGVGGGLVLEGRVWEGAHSHAAECGHIIIQHEGGPRSDFGIHGTVELFVGGRALLRRYLEAVERGALTEVPRYVPAGEAVTPRVIAEAAEAGDPLANELILDSAKYLAIGTVNVIHVLNPEMVLIGGAMTFGQHGTQLGRRFLDALRSEIRARTFPIPGSRTLVDYASLGGDAGFIGAAACARLAFPAAAELLDAERRLAPST
jgi:glucokinase